MNQLLVSVFSLLCLPIYYALPEQGVWHFNVNQIHNFVAVTKVVYKDSALYIKINCDEPHDKPIKISVKYILTLLPCYERGFQFDRYQDMEVMKKFHQSPSELNLNNIDEPSSYFVYESEDSYYDCDASTTFVLKPLSSEAYHKYTLLPRVTESTKSVEEDKKLTSLKMTSTTDKSQATIEDEKSQAAKKESIQIRRKREETADDQKKSDIKEDKSDEPVKQTEKKDEKKLDENSSSQELPKKNHSDATTLHTSGEQPQFIFINEGVYIMTMMIEPVEDVKSFKASVDIKIKGPDGYLSAIDWPMLPFYGTMCGVYVIYGIAWLIVSACQWRDLLRIQFWIGGLIFLGMLEKAVYFGEYQSINNTGKSVQGAVIAAEIVSCLKRTLARMLIIIVSLGFGIVKPRLGALLHRVVGVGALYFILSMIEGLMRVIGVRNEPYRQFWLATISLAVLDSFICYWIFTSLVQTTRTLRLRRNIVKLSLYRHFTNTLIFAVLASVAFMIWSLRTYQGLRCIKDWKELWIDEAYWRLFFSVILLVIMILWRPTNNNQRYAFTPLLDAPDDEEDDIPMPDSFDGMKLRGMKNQNHQSSKGVEDDLKWIDENIPSGISDVALPSLLDSDEEIMTTKFEMSKMN